MGNVARLSRQSGRRVWEGWKRVARTVGDFQARALLTIVYFVVLTPFGLAVRLGMDPLALKPSTARGWRARPVTPGSALTRAQRQF